jgi:hypothetical protein
MMRLFNTLGRWVVAVIVTTTAASAAHSWINQRSLIALGIEIPTATALRTAVGDFIGLAPALGGVLGIALAVGFIVATWLGPRLKVPALLAYPLAGGVAVGVTLAIMRWQMAITPISSAREPLGFALLCGAGALGGLVFIATRRR